MPSSPATANGIVLVGSYDCKVYAFGQPSPEVEGDTNGDGNVDIYDVVTVSLAFGSKPGDENWNSDADCDNNNAVDIIDVVTVCIHFGEHS